MAPFRPAFGLGNAHVQTVYGALFAHAPSVSYRRERWDTPDGDFVDIDFVDGPQGTPWLHLFHGLEGSSRSPYARMLMAATQRRGWRGSVMHFRGCSGEMNRLARAYHSGDSDEIDWVLRHVKALAGASPLYAAGVSLGGNALAKWLGERAGAALAVAERAAVISAPLDLMAAGDALEHGFCMAYSRHFLGTLKRNALAKLARHPGLFDGERVRRARTLREFDNVVTAPLHGFRDTDDYWTRASAKPWLSRIEVPTLILNARDDPFLPREFLPGPADVSPAVTLEQPERGGHVGFVSGPFPGNIRWLPGRVMAFFGE
jgi:predicted alpha/beta-fold hydrolase